MSCELNLLFHLRLISFYTFHGHLWLKTGKFCQKEGDCIEKNAKANYLRPTDEETTPKESFLQKCNPGFDSSECAIGVVGVSCRSHLWLQ